MNDQEFIDYVHEQRKKGLSDNQIARSLGMSLSAFLRRVDEIENIGVDPEDPV